MIGWGYRRRKMARATLFLAGILLTQIPSVAGAAEHCQSNGDTISLALTIEGIRNSKGTISIAAYGDRADDFLAKGKKLRRLRVPAQTGTVHVCLSLPRPGTYAFTAYHDEDNDRHFTKNFIGLPTEGFAVSNNTAPLVGIPSFRDSAVTVNASDSQVIMEMHYP